MQFKKIIFYSSSDRTASSTGSGGDTRYILKPEFLPDVHSIADRDKLNRKSSFYDNYWHIPRASLWCPHNNCHRDISNCPKCQQNVSIC